MNVSRETQKAETKLKNIDKRRDLSLKRVGDNYQAKRRALVEKLPLQVRGMLRAGGVIGGDDLPSDTEFGGELDEPELNVHGLASAED